MASFDFVGGSLKIKGTSHQIKKRKKKKSTSDKEILEQSIKESLAPSATMTNSTTTTATDSSSNNKPIVVVKKTEAELKFEQVQKQRQQARVEAAAKKSHKDRVAEYNKYLESLSEHYDIPRVGPG